MDDDMIYYAKSPNSQGYQQTVKEHLLAVAEFAQRFGATIGLDATAELAGQTHDFGKYSQAFQEVLSGTRIGIDHAMGGACYLEAVYRGSVGARPVIEAVNGHHNGLVAYDEIRSELHAVADPRKRPCGNGGKTPAIADKEQLQAANAAFRKDFPSFKPPMLSAPPTAELESMLYPRMLFSCLVDADFLDTERFMDGERGRGGYDDLPTLLRRLKEYIAPWQEPKTALNKLRCKILNSGWDTGSKPKGIYTLTVPTGGGKTVASLAFALRHAVAHGMKRVIYVVPYTSIIEQNAEVFREILGDGNVLEHHSGVQFELSDGASPEEVRRALAAENWDMPVIVTTAVQFFEAIYANRSSKCRKLHNLADSVIIFDEAQMLPLCHLRPCVAAMASLAEQFRSTLVLCTATQPSLGDLLHTYAPSCPITELCPQTAEEYDSFRRVTFRQAGILEDDALAEKLSEHRQVLCIVNSRKAAQSIFARLPQEASFHLSTLMVPAQRQTLLDEIRRRLKAGEPCRVVSTSLIEAGVDVDFPAVYRELAGLDSHLQAAGRGHRRGHRAAGASPVPTFDRPELPPRRFPQSRQRGRRKRPGRAAPPLLRTILPPIRSSACRNVR